MTKNSTRSKTQHRRAYAKTISKHISNVFPSFHVSRNHVTFAIVFSYYRLIFVITIERLKVVGTVDYIKPRIYDAFVRLTQSPCICHYVNITTVCDVCAFSGRQLQSWSKTSFNIIPVLSARYADGGHSVNFYIYVRGASFLFFFIDSVALLLLVRSLLLLVRRHTVKGLLIFYEKLVTIYENKKNFYTILMFFHYHLCIVVSTIYISGY